MAVSGKRLFEYSSEVDVRLQKLLIHTTAEEGSDRDIKFCGIHIVDQIYQHLFGTAVTEVMDQEKYFCHLVFFQACRTTISTNSFIAASVPNFSISFCACMVMVFLSSGLSCSCRT